jgi:hypothetical protein
MCCWRRRQRSACWFAWIVLAVPRGRLADRRLGPHRRLGHLATGLSVLGGAEPLRVDQREPAEQIGLALTPAARALLRYC